MTAFYHGKRHDCGETLRYRSDGHCVRCNRARNRRDSATPEQWERKLAGQRAHYHNLSGVAYNRLLLRNRRNKALGRMAERNEGRANGAL